MSFQTVLFISVSCEVGRFYIPVFAEPIPNNAATISSLLLFLNIYLTWYTISQVVCMTSWKYSKYCTVTLFSCDTCRSRSTAVQGELQPGGQSWWLSRRIWWGESTESRFSLAVITSMCSSHQGFPSHRCTQTSHDELSLHSFFLLTFTEQLAGLWLPLYECSACTKHHVSGATKWPLAGLSLTILFKHWISLNDLWVFTSAFNCFYSGGCHIWNSALPLRTCIFIQYCFWPLQNFRFSAICTMVFYPAASCRTPPVSPVGVAWTCRTNNLIQDNRERQIIL